MKPVNKSDWRSLWSAGAWYRFGSPFLRSSLLLKTAQWTTRNRCGLVSSSVVSEIASEEIDYQSGTKLPHSKGSADSINAWTSIKCLAIFIFTLLSAQAFGSGEAIAETRHIEELTVVSTAAPVYPPIARAANAQGEVIVTTTWRISGKMSGKKSGGDFLTPKLQENTFRNRTFWFGAAAMSAWGRKPKRCIAKAVATRS